MSVPSLNKVMLKKAKEQPAFARSLFADEAFEQLVAQVHSLVQDFLKKTGKPQPDAIHILAERVGSLDGLVNFLEGEEPKLPFLLALALACGKTLTWSFSDCSHEQVVEAVSRHIHARP